MRDVIKLDNVSKVYRKGGAEVNALKDFSIEVARGEFVAVRGPSGSGKSTLLLMVGGMIRPTSGKVLADGRDLYGLSPRQRGRWRAEKIGFVFQMFHLLPYLNVLENLLVPRMAGAAAGRKEAIELLERFGLAHRLTHDPAELSVGERQRVAVARAMLNRPELVLADEPTGNLDPDSAAVIMEHLAAYHRDGGTVLLVTHESYSGRYAQRTVHLQSGRGRDNREGSSE